MTGFWAFGASEKSSMPPEIAALFQSAEEHEKSGNLVVAREVYGKIIGSCLQSPYGLEACKKAAKLALKENRFADVVPLSVQICTHFQEQPGVFGVLSGLVKDSMYARAYPEAIAVCEEVQNRLGSHPRSTLIVGWLGMIHAHQGDWGNAAKMEKNLLQKQNVIASDFIDALCDIGWGYYCAGRYHQALQIYRQGLERYPEHPGAVFLQYHIVKTNLAKGDMEEADQELDTLLSRYRHRNNTLSLAMRLARDCRKEGRGLCAISICKALLSRYPEYPEIASVWDCLVETYADIGELDKATEILKIDIEKFPHRRELLRIITRVAVEMARRGDTDTAMALVHEIFKQKPEGPDELFGYITTARICIHQGKNMESNAIVEEACRVFNEYPDDLVYHLFGVSEESYYKAQQSMSIGNARNAEMHFKQTIASLHTYLLLTSEKHQRERGKAFYMMARCFWRLGKQTEAAEAFENSFKADPRSPYADHCLYAMGECYRKLAFAGVLSPDDAAYILGKAYSELVSRFPESTYTYNAQSWFQ